MICAARGTIDRFHGTAELIASATDQHTMVDRWDVKHMSDDKQPKQRSKADAELEREIREGRKFTLEEAIARMAGPAQ